MRAFAILPSILTVITGLAWWYAIPSQGLLRPDVLLATGPSIIWLGVLVATTTWRWIRPTTASRHVWTFVTLASGTVAVLFWTVIGLGVIAWQSP